MNLNTWHGVAHDFLEFDSQRSGNNLYVHLKYTKVIFTFSLAADERRGAAAEFVCSCLCRCRRSLLQVRTTARMMGLRSWPSAWTGCVVGETESRRLQAQTGSGRGCEATDMSVLSSVAR